MKKQTRDLLTRPSILFCPVDESFESCDPSQLDPIVHHLIAGSPVEIETPFPRGTHLPDGRLDLCKQCIGPEGTEIVASALVRNDNTKHWLLGANGLSDRGAKAVAETIRENPNLETIYLGCNLIGAQGTAALANSLSDNSAVKGLWLKRNPIGPEGAHWIAQMLQRNRTLRTLDLTHTLIGFDGLREIAEALTQPQTSVRRLYLGGNAIRPNNCDSLAELIRVNQSLHSLYLSVGKLGDDGMKILASAIAENSTLEVLALASNRIGPSGAAMLAQRLQHHPSLRSIDLGYDNSTRVLGEEPNQIGDRGCAALAEWITSTNTLRSIDLCRNGITRDGAGLLAAAIQQNRSLVLMTVGQAATGRMRNKIRTALANNEATVGPYQPPHYQDILAIKSVYRASETRRSLTSEQPSQPVGDRNTG